MRRSSTLLWKWEILAWVGTLGFLLIMIILLVTYNGHPIFDWHGFTLNAVVSVLSTASKAALMVAVAESIAQWKWLLFAYQSRALMDFERVDSASRGPLGSARLLWHTIRPISLLRLGAVITVLALALDPFAQQLVQYEQHLKNSTDISTTISYASRYSKGNPYTVQYFTSGGVDADLSMQSAILFGLAQSYDTVARQVSFSCTTSNCTWSPFNSLAVCSVCNNLTDQLTAYPGNSNSSLLWSLLTNTAIVLSGPSTSFGLPNGLFISNSNEVPYAVPLDGTSWGTLYMTAFGTGNMSKTATLKDIDALIWAMSLIRINMPEGYSSDNPPVWPHLPLDAWECGLYYCVKQYNSIVQNGILHERETIVGNATRNSTSWQPYNNKSYPFNITLNSTRLDSLEFNKNTSRIPRTDLMFGAIPYNFNVSQTSVDSISDYFQNQFASAKVQNLPSPVDPNVAAALNGWYISNNYIQYAPSAMQVFYGSLGKRGNINDTFRSLAKSMSNTIRANSDGALVHTGFSGVMTTYYRIEWPWIVLHVALVVAGVIFLIITIRETRSKGVPAWKSNSLAILARSAEVGEVLEGVDSIEVIERKASEHFVRFFGNGNGNGNDQGAGGEAVEPVEPVTQYKTQSTQHVKVEARVVD